MLCVALKRPPGLRTERWPAQVDFTDVVWAVKDEGVGGAFFDASASEFLIDALRKRRAAELRRGGPAKRRLQGHAGAAATARAAAGDGAGGGALMAPAAGAPAAGQFGNALGPEWVRAIASARSASAAAVSGALAPERSSAGEALGQRKRRRRRHDAGWGGDAGVEAVREGEECKREPSTGGCGAQGGGEAACSGGGGAGRDAAAPVGASVTGGRLMVETECEVGAIWVSGGEVGSREWVPVATERFACPDLPPTANASPADGWPLSVLLTNGRVVDCDFLVRHPLASPHPPPTPTPPSSWQRVRSPPPLCRCLRLAWFQPHRSCPRTSSHAHQTAALR